MINYNEKFRVKPGSKVDLNKVDANYKDKYESKKHAMSDIKANNKKIGNLQYLMYAEGKQSLLIVLQGRDAAGKDGTVNHVLASMNPQGCNVTGFKQPSKAEAAHDFLWRIHKATPERGHVAIFNRSHYEDVLVQRVHNLAPMDIINQRYEHINNFEKLIHGDKNTHILKFYLHIDADEELKRFKQRIDDPARNWKISNADYSERPYWNAYTEAFELALENCSTDHAPWFIIPANNKWFRNLAISQIISEKLESLNMKFPAPSVDLDEIKKKYHADVKETAKEDKERAKKK